MPFVQPQLKVGVAAPRKILSPPFDVEDAVGRGATDRREDPKPTVYRVQIVPIREDGIVVAGPRQALISEGGISGRKLGIAVRRQIHCVKALTIQRKIERQADERSAIIAVVASVGCPCHDAATYLNYRKTSARYRRRGRCGC